MSTSGPAATTPTIRVRRVKAPDVRNIWIDEAEEPLNIVNEFDVTRLSIAKPGEIYRVLSYGGGGPMVDSTSLTLEDIRVVQDDSGYLYVIEQEDWCEFLQAHRDQMARDHPQSWWLRKLAHVCIGLGIADELSFVDYTEKIHISWGKQGEDTEEAPSRLISEEEIHQLETSSSAIANNGKRTLAPRRVKDPRAA